MKKEKYLLGFLLLSVFIAFGCTAPVSEIPEEVQNQVEQPEVIKEPVIEQVVGEDSETIEKDTIEPQPEVKTQEAAAEQSPKSALSPCDTTPLQRLFSNTLYYTGPLFDAHIHMPGLSEINKLLCTFDKEKVKGAVGFYFSPPQSQSLEKMLAEAESIKDDSLEKIRLFLVPVSYSLKTLEDIETTHKGLFTGYGEMAFYNRGDPSQSYYPKSPDEQQFLDLYVLAGKNNFVVMIHPDKGQQKAIENVLQKNPNVKFYLHGEEIESAIIDLMDKYPNVYYSIDATLSRLPYSGDALHVSGTEEEYVSKVKQNFNAMLNGAVNDWKTKIEKHPDRFTWGTDRGGFSWHYGEEVSRLFEELSRAFIGQLDPEVQEKYAYKNAEDLLQKR